MPRLNRSVICASDDVQAFHLINRYVRGAYLCGREKRSGKDYSHCKQWIRDRLEELAGIFGIEVFSFAVLSNKLPVESGTTGTHYIVPERFKIGFYCWGTVQQGDTACLQRQ